MRAIVVILAILAFLPGCAAGWRQNERTPAGTEEPGGANAPSKSERYNLFGV